MSENDFEQKAPLMSDTPPYIAEPQPPTENTAFPSGTLMWLYSYLKGIVSIIMVVTPKDFDSSYRILSESMSLICVNNTYKPRLTIVQQTRG